MLDDLKYIHQRDGQDALGIAEKNWQQLEHQFSLPAIDGPIENVVYGGMGGSALAASISKSWPGYSVPFEICRGYRIPDYVSPKTLFIAASYSGNTEETLAALADAETKGAKIVVLTGGGRLEEIARQKSYPLVQIPKVQQPRFAVLFNLKALATVLQSAGLAGEADWESAFKDASEFLQSATKAWLPTEPVSNNSAKELAIELSGKAPVIYAGPVLAPVAYKWKISFNENAKNLAWWNELPEFNHNEFLGWSSHPIQKPYSIVELRSRFENPKILQRFKTSEKLLSGQWPHPHVVEVQGESLLVQLCWAITYGDFVSIYLALLNNVNPTPVDLVEKFKQELSDQPTDS